MNTMTDVQRAALWDKLVSAVRYELRNSPGCHDIAHVERVLHNAEKIAADENPPDFFAVRTGALLHDIARPEELASGGKICHALAGAGKCVRVLHECGCTDESFIALISDIVRTHRYRGGAAPQTPEAKIVYDADKLDSLGAFGIARAFHFAGRVGAKLHNTAETAVNSAAYSREDTAYREYLVKLRYLPEKMLTSTGKRLALERAEFMHDFFRKLNEESGRTGAGTKVRPQDFE